MSPAVENEVRQYLAVLAKEKPAERQALERIFNQLALHEQADEMRHQQWLEEIKGLRARLTALEADVEDTGRHQLSSSHDLTHLAQQVKEQRESATWLARNWMGLALAGGGLLVSTASIIITLLIALGGHH